MSYSPGISWQKRKYKLLFQKQTEVERYLLEGLSMLHIMICDDEPEFASLLKEKITRLPAYSRRRMTIECITDPKAITEQMARRMDLVFLDIDMRIVTRPLLYETHKVLQLQG